MRKDAQKEGAAIASLRTDSIGVGRRKLIVGGLSFAVLTVGIFWRQFSSIPPNGAAPAWNQLRWLYLAPILLCIPIETLAAGARIWVVCRVLRPGVGLWTCIKAEWANVAVSLLTPSQTGGGPAQIYILSRAGVNAATALTVTLVSFVGTVVGLLCMGLYAALIAGIRESGPLFATAVWMLSGIAASMTLAGVRPSLFRATLGKISRVVWRIGGKRRTLHDWWPPGVERTGEPAERLGKTAMKLVDLVYSYRNDMSRFLRAGKTSFAWVCLLSGVFLFARCFIPYLCIRFVGIETSNLRRIVEIQMALNFFLFFLPTPGGAGLAESASAALMAGIVPAGFVPYYNLLWRFSTFYVAAIGGFCCLLKTLLENAGEAICVRSKLSGLREE